MQKKSSLPEVPARLYQKAKNFSKISFVRDVGVLQAGRVIFILFNTVSSIILARLLKPELYGIYGLVFAFVGLIGIFLAWGGDYASLTLLPQAYAKKDKSEIKNVLTYYIKVTLLAIASSGLIAFLLAPFLTKLLYDSARIGSLSRVVLLATFLAIAYNMLVIVLQAFRHIKKLTILETLNKLFYTFLPIVFVLIGWQLLGLVWGHFLAAFLFMFLSIVFYSRLARKEQLLPSIKELLANLKKIKIKKYFSFGFSIAIDKNIGNLSSFLPVFFLGILAAPQEVAFYKIAFAYITIPNLVFTPISRLLTVQLPKSKIYGPAVLREHFFKSTLVSGLIAVLLILPFIFLAPYLIKFFYGAEYSASISLSYYLAALTVFSAFGVALGPFYRAVNRMKTLIKINISHTIFLTISIVILSSFLSPVLAVIFSLVGASAIFILIQFLVVSRILKKGYEEN